MSFNRDDRRGGGGRDFGRKSFGNRGGGGSDRPEMHKTTCSKCGKECEVPFKPTGSKPVFCRDCFREQGGPDRRSDDRGPRNFERRDDRPRNTENAPTKAQFDELNAKLDKILGMLSTSTPSAKVEETVVAPKKPRAPKKSATVEPTTEIPLENTTEVSPTETK